MRKSIFAILLLFCTAVAVQAGRVVTDSVKSKILGATLYYNVYLPNGFEKGDQTYPVVYLLHGLSDNYQAWKNRGRMQDVADELIESGEARPMIIIMPGAGDSDVRNTWCGYFNMPGWSYEDYFFQELMPTAEKKYRVISDKEHRAVMGLSMGGGGSTVYCQRHPDKFSSCYAMSAWLDNQDNNVRAGEQKDKLYYVTQSVKEHSALQFVRQADEETKAKLRTVRWFFDCGDDDFLLNMNLEMHQLMKAAGIKDELRVRNGVHNWEYWHASLRMALPFASRHFGK